MKKHSEVCSFRGFAFVAAVVAAAVAVAAPVQVGNPGFMYSVPGSFLTVGRCEKGKYMFNTYPGLWIRNVSTSWRENFCRLVPSVDGKDIEVTQCVMRDGWLEACTEKGPIEFAYLRPDVVLVRSKSPEMHIRFEYQFPRQKYDFPSTFGRTIDYLHFNADRILMDTRTGVRDPDKGNTVRVHPSKDGIEVALLDIHTGDWNGATKDQIVSKLTTAMNNGSLRNAIVLAHENYASTSAAMEEFLPVLKANGWQVVTISEMYAVNGKQLTGGQIHKGC